MHHLAFSNQLLQVELFTGEGFTGESLSIFVGNNSDWAGNCKNLPSPYLHNLGSFRPSEQLLCRLYRFVHFMLAYEMRTNRRIIVRIILVVVDTA